MTNQSLVNICRLLRRTNSRDEVLHILNSQSLLVRRLFARLAPFVPADSSKYQLAQNIINTVSCCKLQAKTIVSWNIDSLRSQIIDRVRGKCHMGRTIDPESPMGQLFSDTNPDIICLQETKLQKIHEDCFDINGYHTYWNSSTQKSGYSGVALWSKEKPLRVTYDLPGLEPELQHEGRIITAYYAGFVVVNTYVPNTLRAGNKPARGWKSDEQQRQYELYINRRQVWDALLGMYLRDLQDKIGSVIWCGDLNVARTLQDIHNGTKTENRIQVEIQKLSRPGVLKRYEQRLLMARKAMTHGGGAGLRLEEREGIENILKNSGLIDAFRDLYPFEYGFTWWDRMRPAFRSADNGWRIDYFMLSPNLLVCVDSIKVYSSLGVTGTGSDTKVVSDHAPLVLTFF